MGRRFPDGATSVGGKQGVYVDIADSDVRSTQGLLWECNVSVAPGPVRLIETERQMRKVEKSVWRPQKVILVAVTGPDSRSLYFFAFFSFAGVGI
jgi:hypothetical protein